MIPALLGLLAARRRGSGGGPGGNDANTLLLLHFDGADGSTTFTDSSAGGNGGAGHGTGTNAGTTAEIDTAQSKFGGSSGRFNDGQTIWPNSADWNLGVAGAQDFTIDYWIMLASTAVNNGVFATYNGGAGGYQHHFNNGQLNLWSGAGTSRNLATGVSLNTMQWYHVAIERHASNLNGYLDGVLLGQWADFGLDNDGLGFCIGTSRAGAFTNDMNGWLDEFRISNVARYQSTSFTPPTEAYST